MAAQAVSAHAPNLRQGATTPTSLTYKPIAGSPTLTNPDMILPDYERSDSPDDRSHSPIMLWNNPQIGDMQFHLPQSQPSYTQTYTQQSYHQPSYSQPSYHHQPSYVTGSTPIIYGNGTMLSDIGEVTEAESVVGRGVRRSSYLSVPSDDDIALKSSPTMGAARIKNKSQVFTRERRSSLESNSTVTTQGPNGEFAEFDDAASVDDVHFQGDDEESMASSYVEGTAAKEPGVGRRPIRQVSDDYSLSDRAEQILANAKKRLSTMEGNLSRARISLYYSPVSDGSTPSPPIVRPFTSFRDPTAPLSAGLPTGHSRMLSDSSIHDDPASAGFPRSASALGAAGGYRQPLTSSRSADALGAGISRKLTYQPLDSTLGPLSEDEDMYPTDEQFGQLLSPFDFGSDKDITRSMSVAQVRDLKDQMNDLKGKISSLKEQARADSLKRRSLQSLRTPSPFTHARWDQGFMEPRAIKKADKEESLQPPPAEYTVRQPTPNYADVVAEVQADMMEEATSVYYESAQEAPANVHSVDGSDSTRTEQAVEHKKSVETIGQGELVIEQRTNDEYAEHKHAEEQHIAEQVHAEELVDERHLEEQHEEQHYVNDDVDEESEHFEEEANHLVAEDEDYETHQSLGEHTTLEEEMRQVEEEQWEEEEMEHELEEQEEEYEEEEQEGEGEFEDDVSDSGESLYHDTYQEPLSHEDREDAFDYEHFFLHSAMGTISQQRGRRGSFDSVMSDDSVETTRGPVTDDSRAHRRISIDTLSSVNSFATATEGRTSRTSTIDDGFDDRTASTPDLSEYPEEPLSSKRTTFGGFHFPNEKASNDFHQQSNPRRNTIVHRPVHSDMTSAHRPSVSSFESTGTNRSFPLVNKTRISGGVLTPSGSPDHELDQISETLMNETASICEQETGNSGQSAAIELLPREDRILVEKLVASVGKCVLSLSEVSKASTEARMYRRRLEAARRILEGLEE